MYFCKSPVSLGEGHVGLQISDGLHLLSDLHLDLACPPAAGVSETCAPRPPAASGALCPLPPIELLL